MAKIETYATNTPVDDDKVLGTDDTDDSSKNYKFSAINTYLIGKKVTAPATAAATGVAGDYAVAAGFIYICVATNTWQRAVTATW